MNFSVPRFYLLIVFGLMAVIHTWPAAASERWALLIGNMNYAALPPLSNPVNDINNLGERLEGMGFHVVKHEDLSDSETMGKVVQEFAGDAKAAGVESVLVHYAGHGFEIGGENYLVPAGITQASEPVLAEQIADVESAQPMEDEVRQVRLGEMRLEHIRQQSLRLNEVLGLIEEAAPTRILLFDACRDVPDMRSMTRAYEPEMTGTGFAVAQGGAGTLITFSAQPGQVASDGSGSVSPFMHALLNHIDLRGIDINELMTRVRRDVHANTQGYQVPWTHSALLEPFSFSPAPEGSYDTEKVADVQETSSKEGLVASLPAERSQDEERQKLINADVATPAEPAISVAAIEPVSRDFESVEEAQKKIVIIGDTDFVADRLPDANAQTTGLPDALVDRIVANLSKSPRFRVLERQALRRVISEQRFDRQLGDSYLETTFEQDFGDVRPNEGDVVIVPDSNPADGSGIVAGSGLGSSAATADYLDLLKDFKDLGGSIGAEYLVFGRLEAVDHEVQERQIPYTDRTHVGETVNARLRLRVVDVEQAKVISAVAFESELEADVLKGSPSAVRSAMFDQLAGDVAGALVDSFHQAAVVQTDPLVIDRGAIHGLKPGDSFTIQHEGSSALVSQDGVSLGGQKSYVATVRVVAADNLWSEVELIDGIRPALYDLARLDRNKNQNGSQASARRSRDSDGEGGKRVLALGKVEIASGGRFDLPPADLAPRFSQELANGLRNTRRYIISERHAFSEVLNETDLRNLIEGGDGLPDELKTADYIVLTRLDNLLVERAGEYVQVLDETFDKTKAIVEIQARMVDTRSFEQVAAETIRFERKLKDNSDPRLLLGDMLTLAADEVVQQIMTASHPVEIIGGDQGQWYVNRGADGGLSIGDTFSIYRQGEEMKDAAGTSFGRAETEVGRAMVVQVDGARSMIKIQDVGGNVSVGDILRPIKQDPAPTSKVKSPKW